MASESIAVQKTLEEFGERIVKELRNEIKFEPVPRRNGKSYVLNASGDLEKTLRYEVKDGVLRVYANHYIYYLLFGRKPGKKPPRDVIVKWIQDKGIQSNIPIQSLAFLIQRAIGERGTLLYPQGARYIIDNIINENFVSALNSELMSGLLTEVVESFKTIQKAA